MDLLSRAYAAADGDDGDLNSPPNKRPRVLNSRGISSFQQPEFRIPIHPVEAPISGSYVSKRQRAALAASQSENIDPAPISTDSSPAVVGSLRASYVPVEISTALRLRRRNGSDSIANEAARLPLSASLRGHSKPVNALQWSRKHNHLLASAGMDGTVRIWNVWSDGEKQARILNCHGAAAVRDVKWSPEGLSVLSCGYDCASRLIDVEKGMENLAFEDDQMIEAVKFCPSNGNVFLSGGSKGRIKLWDVRTGKAVHEYVRKLGPILDVEFTNDGNRLISSSDVSRSNISENAIIVWDVSREIPLSNQVYTEPYTCTCIRRHPREPYFVAQSNGNYIAAFGTRPPFRMDKRRRYSGHGVGGFNVKCDFSIDGETLASGSSDGYVHLYDSETTNLVKRIKTRDECMVDVSFHPSLPNVIASCGWNGAVSV
ncbi:hypothetical protein M569_12724, partial [Genlisea aurea]